jgi:hypothetical protein
MLNSATGSSASTGGLTAAELDRLKGEQVRQRVVAIEARTRGLGGIHEEEVAARRLSGGGSGRASRAPSAHTSPVAPLSKQWPPPPAPAAEGEVEGQQEGVSAAFRAASRIAQAAQDFTKQR